MSFANGLTSWIPRGYASNRSKGLLYLVGTILMNRAASTLALQQPSSSSSLQRYQHDDDDDKKQNKRSLRVFVLRHGQTDANASGIIQGSSDISRLTDLGKQQAAEVVQAFQSDDKNDPSTDSVLSIAAVYCSPLTRARETLQVLRQQQQELLSLPPAQQILHNLREIDFYDWESRDKEYLQDNFAESYQAWKEGDPHKLIVYEKESIVHYPLLELWERANQVWEDIFHAQAAVLADKDKDIANPTHATNILIVAHGSLGQALLGTAMGWDATYFRRHEFPNCGMAEIVWENVKRPVDSRPLATKWRWKWPRAVPNHEWNTFLKKA